MKLPQRLFISGVLVGQLFISSAYAEKGPGYGVSNLLGEPSLAAKVSQGAEAVARKLSAGSASARMNEEVSKLLDPRKSAPAVPAAAPVIPYGQQIVNLNAAAPVRVTFPRMPASRPGQPTAQSAVTPPDAIAPPPAPAPSSDGQTELNAALEKVRAMLGSPVSKNSPTTPPAAVAAELEQIEAKVNVTDITRGQLGAQLPGAQLNVPSDWEREEVEALIEKKPSKSDLSGYINNAGGAKPAAPTRLLDSLSGASEKPSLWKPKPKRRNSSINEVLSWKNPLASGSNRVERARAKDFLARPERSLRVAKLAPVRVAAADYDGVPTHGRSGSKGIREISYIGDAE